jgi:excinuclease UvrABC nuclease subunit
MRLMSSFASIFPHSISFDPAADFEAFLKSVPAKHVVYLLADEADRPVQLLCVKNLRYSLKRRLGTEELAPESPAKPLSKRVNYRELVRRIHWIRVDSTFEADWLYLEAARACFPDVYSKMLGFRPAWFVHVDPDEQFPRYVKTSDLAEDRGQYLGPLEDKGDAAKLIELIEDAFDLCRYYSILQQTPRGKPCAYKEMGKCPAPCDNTIGLEQYRRMIELSVRTLIDPGDVIREHTRRMQAAAKELHFEIAGKIKQYVDQLSQIGNGPFRFVKPLRDFAFVALQQGPKPGSAKVFLITPGRIEPVATILNAAEGCGDVVGLILKRAEAAGQGAINKAGEERIAVVAAHLFSPKGKGGSFIPLPEVRTAVLLKGCKDLVKTRAPDVEVEDEGIVKELNV